MRLRKFALAFVILVLIPGLVLAISSQRAQIGVAIIVNVTPNPLGYAGRSIVAARRSPFVIAHLREVAAPLSRPYDAQALQILPGSDMMIAQAKTQAGVEVMASISPNPNATLLVSNQPSVTESVEAGVKTTFKCVYQVTVSTTNTDWQLKYGLSADFTSGSATFPGNDLTEAAYVVPPSPSPSPAETAFPVYADNGGIWSITNGAAYSGSKTFCVDLTFNVPIAIAQGTYSSNAIYTLYY